MNADDIMKIITTGLFTGLGSGIGSYLATKYAITHFEKTKETINKKVKKGTGGIREMIEWLYE